MIEDLIDRLGALSAEIKDIQRELGRVGRKLTQVSHAPSNARTTKRRGAPRTSDEWAPRARELYESGLSVVHVAAEVGSNQGTVRSALLRLGVQFRGPGGGASRKNAERNKAIVAAYEDGERNASEVAKQFGISRERVRQVLVRAGITTDGPGSKEAREREARYATIKRLWQEEGKTAAEIGQSTGISTATVLKVMREMGYTVEKRSRITAKTRRALMMFRAGTSVAEITKALGYTNEIACRATLHRHGESDQIRAMREAAEHAA
jgi:hypothetical protein